MIVTIFISYARSDMEQVLQIYKRLSAETEIFGVELAPWIDKEKIDGGRPWIAEIRKAINQSDIFLVCISKNSYARRGVLQEEIRLALENRRQMLDEDIYLIPLRLDDCEVPEKLKDIQWINFFEEDGYSRLLRSIEKAFKERIKEEREGKDV